jgi:hypothetical protein
VGGPGLKAVGGRPVATDPFTFRSQTATSVRAVRLEDWSPYELELEEVFRWNILTDPDPSEWFSVEDFLRYRKVLDAVRKARVAGAVFDETNALRIQAGRDATGDRLAEDHERAAAAWGSAKDELARLNADTTLQEIRARAEQELARRRR